VEFLEAAKERAGALVAKFHGSVLSMLPHAYNRDSARISYFLVAIAYIVAAPSNSHLLVDGCMRKQTIHHLLVV
jgi:hypothetical protein